jgi:hypothetical protein
MAMVRIVARVEPRICTTSRTKGHNHLKKDTVESEDEKNQCFSHNCNSSRMFDRNKGRKRRVKGEEGVTG